MEMESFDDGSFNLAVASCQGDLSLAVFNTWLTLGLDAAFIALSIPNLVALLRGPRIVHAPAVFLVSKLVLGAILVSFNIALLILTRAQPGRQTPCSLSLGALDLVTAFFSLALSICAHFKSRRPSTLLCCFLLISLLSNVAKCQELWSVVIGANDRTFAALVTAATIVQVPYLAINAQWRMAWVSWESTDHSPEEISSIFGLGFYSWLNELLLRGYRRTIGIDDLYPLDQAISANVFNEAARHFPDPEQQHSNLDVLRWAIKPLIKPLLLPVLPRLCLIGFTFCQPLFIQRLLVFLNEGGATTSQITASGLIGATVLIYFGIAISTSLYWYYQERVQSMLRAYLVLSIYYKTAESRASGDLAAVTLMSTDVDRIYTGVRNIHEIWANVIEIALACWLLQRLLGLAFLAPLIVVLLGFASSFTLSKYAVRYQRNWMRYVQERIDITSNALSRIKELRISGLIRPVTGLVQDKRVEEIHHGEKSRSLIATSATLSQVPHVVAPVVAFAFGPRVLGNTTAFTSLSYLALLTSPLTIVLQIIPIVAACLACLRRIHDFLAEKPKPEIRKLTWQKTPQARDDTWPELSIQPDTAVQIRNGWFGWNLSTCVLRDINFTVPSSLITFIIGPTASGKTTLVKAILGEVPSPQGDVIFNADPRKVAFCDQAPILMNTSIVENIVGFSPFDATRYREVIQATLLLDDFKTLPAGDKTKIGSKGSTLSGGQRQRVSLARALYHDAELLVLDDIFTGLDSNTQRQISQRVFGDNGLLRRRKTTAILCTQATQFLPLADHILALEPDGTVHKEGSFEAFKRDDKYLHLFNTSEWPHENGDIEASKGATAQGDEEEIAQEISSAKDTNVSHTTGEKVKPPNLQADISVYRHYLSTIGYTPLVVYLCLICGMSFCENFPAIWLKIWSADSIKDTPSRSFAFYMGIYGFLAGLTLFFVFSAGSIVLRTFVRLSGTHLHKQTLKAAMHASLRMLTATDTGIILNLFSQDMTIIDAQLPRMVNNMCICAASAVGKAAVIAASSGYLAICYPFFLVILYLVQKFYLPTSKQLRLLDLEAKSPLYTHFLDTLGGLATLRAFGWLPQQAARSKELLDTSQRPSYLLAMVQQWLLLTMNMIVTILGIALVSIATYLRNVDAGSVGAGLVMLMTLGSTLSTVVNAYTGLEISLGAIERLKTFSETTDMEDKNDEVVEPPEEWPASGKIVVSDLSASYSGNPREPTLSNLSLVIQPGEKVALCGRTGSGKSSVVALFLRLLDPLPDPSSTSTGIAIDDVPLGSINRTALRTHLIAASQDAVFLPDGSSFRENLDPWHAASTEETHDVLETMGLDDLIGERGGVDAAMRGAELSAGQRQLFALGRAVLRRRVRARLMAEKGLAEGGVLLLDEVTASVDRDAEERMAQVIWREFGAYTVLVVTHSVDLASRCDRVLVLDRGVVVEDGSPNQLLSMELSAFQALARAGHR